MHLQESPDRKRAFGSACDEISNVTPAQRTHAVLSWRRLLLSRAKLKATSRTSALLSGFAMVAMVEIQLNDDYDDCNRHPPNETRYRDCNENKAQYDALLIAFAIVTTLLIATHMFALLISTCILPNLEAVTSVSGCGIDISDSPHDKFHWYIETAWICSTGFGIILFLVEIGLLCWIKFFHTKESAYAATIILIPLVLMFAFFAFEFYRRLVDHKEATTTRGVRELDVLADTLLKMEDDQFNLNANNHNDITQQTVLSGVRDGGEDGLSTGTNGSDDAGSGGIIY